MEINVTPCTSMEELQGALGPIWHYFGTILKPEDMERWSRNIEIPRMLVARQAGQIIGGAGAYAHELTVPGGTVEAAAVTVVGVLPTHRRRGVLSAMMRAQLDDVRKRGEPVAYLWASEESIYGRFGYGMASLCGEIDLPRASNAFVRRLEPRGETRILTEEEAYEPISRVYDRIRRDSPGMFVRSETWWKARRLADPESRRQGGGPLHRVLLRIDGEPAGYALYRLHQSMETGVSTGFLSVLEAMGTTPEATREIWRFLFDVDWIARVKTSLLPIDHPLFFLLSRPRLMRFRLADGLWVRLVDVAAALEARSLADAGPVVIEVADAFCQWNEGRYRIAGGRVERTQASPDLALEVHALGSVYLGGFTFATLARAGGVRELKEGAASRADAIFTRNREPWCPEIF
jgi:predicted acetyltransferase